MYHNDIHVRVSGILCFRLSSFKRNIIFKRRNVHIFQSESVRLQLLLDFENHINIELIILESVYDTPCSKYPSQTIQQCLDGA